MIRRRFLRAPAGFAALTSFLALCAVAGAQHPAEHDPRVLEADPRLAPGQLAPVLEGLGEHHREVTTSSERAQLFFDQGLKLTYGFNHKEALRAFKEAARLDPDCAMAYWGWALVLGPNLNLPMFPDVVPEAWEGIQLALARRDKVSPKERGLIDALARRYTEDPEADRAPLDAAYAEAMGKLHARYGDDDDVATLYAASLMNLSPWNYWTRDGRPREHTPKILAALEAVLERDGEHVGALHYYIHAVEPVDAARGEWAADQLRGLTPGAGHLVHMPSHIYMQVGRFADSYEANAKAAEADEGYITQCRAQGIYPLGYYPHNVHFLAWSAMMQGRGAAAVEASRKVASRVPEDLEGNTWSLYEVFLGMPYAALVRFGKWPEVLAEPAPSEDLGFLTAMWRYARGTAYVHTGKLEKAAEELARLAAIAEDPATAEGSIGLNGARRILTIARAVLTGELAARQGRYEEGLGHLERAVRLEDGLLYNEPPDWYYPVRHLLGAMLLEAGRPEEAEVVYDDDLRDSRENGYALYGLWQSLLAQGREDEAAAVEARFRAAWADADVELVSSRF